MPLVLFGHDLSGTTANRPANAEIGQPYYDTTLGAQLAYNGTAWEVVAENTVFATVAAAGTNQATAAALTAGTYTVVTGADATTGVKLPTAVAELVVTGFNDSASVLKLYPGTSDDINNGTVNVEISVAANSSFRATAIDATTWDVQAAFTSALYATLAGAESFTGVKTFTLPQVLDHNTTITAFATGGQASAVALTGEWNNVTTCVTAGDSVKLLTAVSGQAQTVKNSGATTLAVFPNTSDAINALGANLSVDIPPGGELTFRALDATTWETCEALVLPAPSTQKGSLIFQAADNSGNTNTIVTNAAMAAARTLTIPDPGANASFIMTAGAQSLASKTLTTPVVADGLSASGSAANTFAASTGTFITSSGKNTLSGQAGFKAIAGAVAAAGSSVADAGQLGAANTVYVSSDGATKGVKLQTGVLGDQVEIINTTATALELYAASGGTVNGLAPDASVVIPASKGVRCFCSAADTWHVFDMPAKAAAS